MSDNEAKAPAVLQAFPERVKYARTRIRMSARALAETAGMTVFEP